MRMRIAYLLVLLVHVCSGFQEVKYGDFGNNVYTIQNLLLHRLYSLTETGRFDTDTKSKVTSFQTSQSLVSDGVVNQVTWEGLIVSISLSNSGKHVRALEYQLKKHGYDVVLDSVYDASDMEIVKNLQVQFGLVDDGVVGTMTWEALVGNNNSMTPPVYEFRGAWVATVYNIDWPSSSSASTETKKVQLTTILDHLVDLKMNAIVLQVRPEGDSFYQSSVGEPWSHYLTGKQGTPPNPFFDPLDFAVSEAHKRGIELHAWFNPYRAASNAKNALHATHVCTIHSNFCYPYSTSLWMDPGAEVIQNRTFDVVMDVLMNYDVDGIHFDDYFYPYPDGNSFPDSNTYQAYLNSGGKMAVADWRRDNVNRLVQRVYRGIQAKKPYVKFGISPFGIYKSGTPPGTTGFDQYSLIFADPKYWLEQGWLDYIAPQLYWRIDPPAQSYPVLLDWWTSINPLNRHIYVGNYLSKLDEISWFSNEFQRQVEISRSFSQKHSLGNIMYSMKMFTNNAYNIRDYFKNNIYTTDVQIPPMDWLPTRKTYSETLSLLSWYNNLSSKQFSWNTSAVVLCGQTGISCNNENSVTEINLSGFSIMGPIFSSFAAFTSLTSLNLGNNKLTGKIPEDIFTLAFLDTILLSPNYLSCPIVDYSNYSSNDFGSLSEKCGKCNLAGCYSCSIDGASYDELICEDINECSLNNSCHINSNCMNTVGSYFCECHIGFEGDGKNCQDMNECQIGSSDCGLNTNCVNINGSYLCECVIGYERDGNVKDCEDMNECQTGANDCGANSNCVNTLGSYLCECLDGYERDGGACIDIDECLNNQTCHANAKCVNNDGSFACDCQSGYEGNGKTCNDVDECQENNGGCDINAICTNLQGSNLCECKTSYIGNGFECNKVDSCLEDNGGCHPLADCMSQNETIICTCKEGYTGDGIECADINECLIDTICPTNTTCLNDEGSYQCVCKVGFESISSSECVDINECLGNNAGCHSSALCINLEGSFKCTCEEGFEGDGFNCNSMQFNSSSTLKSFSFLIALILCLVSLGF